MVTQPSDHRLSLGLFWMQADETLILARLMRLLAALFPPLSLFFLSCCYSYRKTFGGTFALIK